MTRFDLTQERVVFACKTSQSMAEAARKLNCHLNTFSRYAKKYGVYKPNMGLKGCKRPKRSKIKTKDILKNKCYCQTFKLKNRLLDEGIKEHRCELCGRITWNGKPISLELHHVDGNPYNNRLRNLKILCPNCHAQTDNYRSKNKKSSS